MSKHKFGYNLDEEKSDWVRIGFPNMSKKQMEHMHKAERELLKAGVSFDTGFLFSENRRDWEFDWSLKGAVVKVKKKAGVKVKKKAGE